jgi:opacity protein-like surface antigen
MEDFMVRALKTLLFLSLASCLVPASALAQGKTSQGDMAISANIGFANAIEDDFEGLEPFFNGTFEYHVLEELSLRGMLGFTSFDHDSGGDVDLTIFAANAVYYWDTGDLQPFVTGGVGFYDVDVDIGPFSEGDMEFAINGGGGLDIPVGDTWAIKIEGLFHGISGDGPDQAFTLTGGIKWRF